MKISNGIDKIGINNDASLKVSGYNYAPIRVKGKDTYNSNLYSVYSNGGKTTTPIFGAYTPNQLLSAYSNKDFIEYAIQKNPDINKLLNEHGVDCRVIPENITKVTNSHLIATKAIALQIANQMNISQSDKQLLEYACMFHDLGKILIPDDIINKHGALTPKEKEIMNLHAQLGYDILSVTNLNKRVLELVKNHHMKSDENSDILGQILSVADIYSALREERAYKKPLSKAESLNILDQKARNGEVSTEVVNALKSAIYAAA